MYSILILAAYDDREELDLPQALDPQLCTRLSSERDSPQPLQQPLTFRIGPLSLQRDCLYIPNAVGELCSKRFIEVLTNASVPFTAYPALLLDAVSEHPIPNRYFFWLPKRIKREEIVDLDRSEVRVDDETGSRRLAKLVLKDECETAAPLLFETAGGCLVHDTLRAQLEAAGIKGILFAPLDTAYSPHSGVRIEELKQHLQEHPDDWKRWVELSRRLVAFRRYDEALQALDRALALHPEESETWYKRGQALYKQGDLQQALHALRRAIELDPQSWAWKEQSAVLRELGRFEEAVVSAQHLVQIKDKAYVSWYELALAHLARGEKQEALQALERSLLAGGNASVEIARRRGELLLQLGRFEDARAAYEFGLRAHPRVRALWAGKAQALRALERFEEAEAAEQEVHRLEQKRAEALQRGPW